MKFILPILMTPLALASPLADQLKKTSDAAATRLPAEVRAEFAKGIDAVRKTDIVSKAKQVGDTAPDFTLKNASGKEVTLSEQLKKGPVILTWYRGGWCPYCNLALAAYQKKLPEFKEAGATFIALTPELPDKSLSTMEKNQLEFEVLTDLNHEVAEKYGLLFKLTPKVEELYKGFFDLSKFNGVAASDDTLPLAATYIIDTDGQIHWAFLDADYRNRAEPADIIKALNELK